MSEICKEINNKELENVSGGKSTPEKDTGTYWILRPDGSSAPSVPFDQNTSKD